MNQVPEEEELYLLLNEFSNQLIQELGVDELSVFAATKNAILITNALSNLFFQKLVNGTALSRKCFELYLLFEDRPEQNLKKAALLFFQNNFTFDEIIIKDTFDYSRLNCEIVLATKKNQNINYFVRIHSKELGYECKGLPWPVDIRELFVLKIFEGMGVGPEVHFFYDDISNFYIALKDEIYDEVINMEGQYYSFNQIKKNFTNIQQLLAEPSFVKGVMLIDILTLLLSLTNVIHDTQNFGFSFKKQKSIILDFKLPSVNCQRSTIFYSWMYRSQIPLGYQDSILRSILWDKEYEQRLLDYKYIERELTNFQSIVKHSKEVVQNFVKDIQGLQDIQIRNLDNYERKIYQAKQNFEEMVKSAFRKEGLNYEISPNYNFIMS